jgi:hypothetical protein
VSRCLGPAPFSLFFIFGKGKNSANQEHESLLGPVWIRIKTFDF